MDTSLAPSEMKFGSDVVTKDPSTPDTSNSGYKITSADPTSTSNSVVSTSDDHRGMIGDLGQSITDDYSKNLKLLSDTTGIQSDADTSTQAYQTYRDNLKNEEAQTETNINNDYDQKDQQLQQKQTNETGAESSTLARVGGYLGAGTAAGGVMQNLSNTHVQEVNTLENARKSAISQAQSAYNNKDFAAAKEQMDIAKTLEQNIYDRQKEFATQALNYYKQVQDQQKSALDQATKEAATQQKNAQFAIKNGITKPFYSVDGTTLISTQTGKALSSMDEYTKLGGKGDGSDIQYTSSTPVKFETKNIIGSDGKTHSVHIGYNAQGHVISQEDLGVSTTKKTGTGTSGDGSNDDLLSQVSSKFDDAETALKNNDPNWDGKMDPSYYTGIRDKYVSQFPTKQQANAQKVFDTEFSSRLSAQQRANLGIGKATGKKAK